MQDLFARVFQQEAEDVQIAETESTAIKEALSKELGIRETIHECRLARQQACTQSKVAGSDQTNDHFHLIACHSACLRQHAAVMRMLGRSCLGVWVVSIET